MIRVFYGDDRVKATAEVRRILGDEYEVIEVAEIARAELPSVLMGATLFSEKRKILIRDLLSNTGVRDEVAKFVDTPHEVILLESKLDKRAAVYKALKDKVEFFEFKAASAVEFSAVFDVYRIAKRDGARAVLKLRELEPHEDPVMFFGLLVSQALKDFTARPGVQEKKVLKMLAEVDVQMKSSKIEPWLLVEGAVMRLGSL